MTLNIISLLDYVTIIEEAIVEGKGEDSFGYFFHEEGGVLATFDGCGGLGARKYEHYNMNSGAYIASRAVSAAVLRWFYVFSNQNGKLDSKKLDQISSEMRSTIKSALSMYKEAQVSGLKSTGMSREFPTTASVVMFAVNGKRIDTAFFWAGDSRGYILNSEGLAQITTDDLAGNEDAFENLSSDARLENVVAADGKFRINHKIISLVPPFIAITATDGCFGYFQTPMEFEFMLLETLLISKNADEWKKRMHHEMSNVAGDDFSLGIAVFGYGDFKNLKKDYQKRHDFLKGKYIARIPSATSSLLYAMWCEYQQEYDRFKNINES